MTFLSMFGNERWVCYTVGVSLKLPCIQHLGKDLNSKCLCLETMPKMDSKLSEHHTESSEMPALLQFAGYSWRAWLCRAVQRITRSQPWFLRVLIIYFILRAFVTLKERPQLSTLILNIITWNSNSLAESRVKNILKSIKSRTFFTWILKL